ncbi:hypothetical protein MTO96_030871 [Rhipicephalus appendiculatus]
MWQTTKAWDLLARATVQTVPETLECELYDGRADDEIATYQPQLSAVAEEGGNEDSVRSRGAAEPTQVPNEKRLIDCMKEEEMDAELTDSEASFLDRVARPASPRETWDIDEVPPSNALSTTTPARPVLEIPCRRLQSAEDNGDKSPSLLDAFAAPRTVSDPCASDAVKEVHPSSPPASDVTVCDVTVGDSDLPRKQVQRDNGKLSLLRKRCASPTEPAEVFMVQPTSRAKRKKQTKLSDRYFLSVNRSTVPATRSSSMSVKKELSQARVDDSLLSTQSKRIDLDETFVEPELLRDFKAPVTAKASGSTGALQNGDAATQVKKDLDKADEASRAEEPSSSSQAEPFKCHNSPVRKKADRQRLPAHECKECEEFYGRLDLPEAQRKELLRKCSRHRAHHAPPATPEHFWELDFPDTQVCRERGYLNATQKVRLRFQWSP